MIRLAKLCSLSIIVLIISSWLRAGDVYRLRIQVYHGKQMEDASSKQPEALWRASQEQQLSILREAAGASDMEWSANVVKALFAMADLETANELFTVSRTWDGRAGGWFDRFLGNDVAFLLDTSVKRTPDKRISFQATMFRSKEGVIPRDEGLETRARRALEARTSPKKMDKILERALDLEFDDPVVICSPWEGGVFFVVISLVQGPSQPKLAPSRAKEPGFEMVGAPPPLRQVQPYYPESLRNRRIEGKVRMLVAIDASGAVIGTKVIEPLHSYLDYSAVQALLRERFEPVLKNGKPVEAVFPYEFVFDRLAKLQPEGGDRIRIEGTAASGRLSAVLAGCAAYCRSLSESMLDYVCEETMNEISYGLRANPLQEVDYIKTWRITTISGYANVMLGAPFTLMDPQLTRRTRYLCDYQIVKDHDVIKERRIILRKGGKKVSEGIVLEEKRYSYLMPVLIGVKVLAADRQSLFMFRLIGEGKVQGKECDIVEALPKSGNEEGLERAKIWIDKTDHRIRRCEIEGVPVEGFEEVLTDCVQLGIHPHFVAAYEYGTNYRTVSLPSRTEVQIEYPVSRSLGGPVLKATIDMKYAKYRYFGVKTDHDIIK